ncbi:uroporphyrinogen decarboxylase family protein [Sporohalobacter salinus]|uniref:uroporphyrinogen decarboxylase family protein n=1 Tax=Sporohalobacter salinus TaxID=1494606 RepID=UPI00195F54F1|nr:uroporphyrinogen decarboxylase family protein [Sporohalobacter salinus]MBM7625037.1 uroporphyrinogen decarboxylase [Sporohalobacter salinus]
MFDIPEDKMTPRERMEAFSEGKEIDRIPCAPFLGESCAPLIGTTIAEYNHSSELIAELGIKSFEMFRPDSISTGPGLQGIPEAMGSEVAFPTNSTPYISKPFLDDYNKLDQLSPIEPYQDGRIHLFLEGLKKIKNEVGSEVIVGSSVGGPFTTAAFMRGPENFLKDLNKNPEGVHKLLKITTESVLRYIDAVCDLDMTPSIAEPTASSTLISSRMFTKFAQPYLKECMNRVAKRRGSASTLHICGQTKPIWNEMVDASIANLSLDNEEDLAEAKTEVGDKVCLIGNVKPVETMLRGNKEDIFAEAKECIAKAYDNPNGFILSTGCDVPVGTSVENIVALMDAARFYGQYPVEV